MCDNTRIVVKVKFDKLKRNDIDYSDFYKCIESTNQLIHIGYLFIRSYFLHLFENTTNNEPSFNIDFIRLAFSVISFDGIHKRGRPFDENKNIIVRSINDYYDIFRFQTKVEYQNIGCISYILGQTYDKIYNEVVNNIRRHFDKHVWKFIRAKFDNEYQNIINNKNKNNREILKEFYSKLNLIKSDIYKNTENSPNMYHKWIKKIRAKIIPVTYTESKFETDVSKNTTNYLRCMYNINKYIQKKDLKSLQIFPIRTTCYQNYVKINTSALIDIFIKNDKIGYFKKAGDIQFQEEIWNKYFKLKKDGKYQYMRKGFSFNYEIETDAYAVSLNFINNNDIEKKNEYKKNKRKKRQETIEMKKEMSSDVYQKTINEQKENTLKQKEKIIEEQKENTKKKRDEFKKLSAEEQHKIKLELEFKKEFPYIESMVKDEMMRKMLIEMYINGKLILCDPGQKSILTLMACNRNIHKCAKNIKKNNFGISIKNGHKIMSYTNKTRIKFLKREHYAELIEKWKNEKDNDKFTNDIQIIRKALNYAKDDKTKKYLIDKISAKEKTLKELEHNLSNYNSKSCAHDEFIEYVRLRLEYNNKIMTQYDTEYLQKLNWFTYLNKRKHEDELLNHIENEFGKDIIIIIGDWSAKGKPHHMSTPNIGIKRKLAERFTIYSIDEYLTSKLHYKYEMECQNMKVKLQTEEKSVSLHSVLSYKIEKRVMGRKVIEMGCINRDFNSVLNMESILVDLLFTCNKPKRFDRTSNRKSNSEELTGKLSDASGAYRSGMNQ